MVSPGFRFPEGYTPPPSTRSRSRSRASQQVLRTRTATGFRRLTSDARRLNEFRDHVGSAASVSALTLQSVLYLSAVSCGTAAC